MSVQTRTGDLGCPKDFARARVPSDGDSVAEPPAFFCVAAPSRDIREMAYVSIDGNIGCGKTSVLNVLRAFGHAIDLEPVDAWGPLLVDLYAGRLSAYDFQKRAFADRCGAAPPLGAHVGAVTFVERSPLFQSRVFVEANAPDMTAAEVSSLRETYATKVAWTPDLYVYLRATTAVCARRIAARARAGEDRIADSYLERLHALHETTYADAAAAGTPIIVLDVDALTVDEVARNLHILCANLVRGPAART